MEELEIIFLLGCHFAPKRKWYRPATKKYSVGRKLALPVRGKTFLHTLKLSLHLKMSNLKRRMPIKPKIGITVNRKLSH